MKITRNVLACLSLALLSATAIGAQDLSKYRNFSLQSSLAVVSKQADVTPDEVNTTYRSPAVIQDFSLWPIESSEGPARSEDVQQMQFSFCNGELYKIVVTYRTAATEGLTAEDMVQAVSAKYGIAERPAADSNPPKNLSYSSADTQVALWEDAQYSVALSHSPLSESFQLVVLSKQLERQANAAIADAVAQERDDAPQREVARVKKEAEDLQTLREANIKAFRP